MKIYKLILGMAAAMILAVSAQAQNIGLYSPFSGAGSVLVPAASTNTFYLYQFTNGVWNGVIVTNSYQTVAPGLVTAATTNLLTQNVASFENVGFSFGFTPLTGATNAPIGVAIYRSYDFGRSFESNPYLTLTNGPTAAALASFNFNTNLAAQGVTTLGYNVYSLPAVGLISNVFLNLNLKAGTIQVTPFGINPGVTPGSVIHVSGFN